MASPPVLIVALTPILVPELAVAHIDEVAVPDELPQIIPDGTVNLVVGRVPVEEAKVDRDILIC
jgi:hypothetical protein